MTGPDPFAPHHDGSPVYAEGEATHEGTLTLRVRVPRDAHGRPGAEQVVLRSVKDGEPFITDARCVAGDEAGSWWEAPLQLWNPHTSYRFLLAGGRPAYRWLNAEGVWDRDVTDASDFTVHTGHRLPDWVLDQVGYQVFPDRFARPVEDRPAPLWANPAAWDDPVVHQGPEVPFQWYGGTLDAAADRLAHVTGLGCTLVYLTPFFEAWSNHRYDARSFDHVDPSLGGDAALARLVDVAHAAGVRVMGDLTTNHTGATHEWFAAARAAADAPERDFYGFHGDSYHAWLGIPSLPKLDHRSGELRRRLYDGEDSVVARWLRAGLDAWRVDVANMTGRLGDVDLAHEVARTVRATMRDVDPDAWLLAEHGHDASHDLAGDGWQGTMDYAGFTRPVWAWLNGGGTSGPGVRHGLRWLGLPVDVPVVGGVQAAATMRQVHAAMPWASWTASASHLDSHDTPRFRTVAGGGVDGGVDSAGRGRGRHLVGLALQMTMPGVPMVWMGDEIGLTGVDGEHSRTPFPWQHPDRWDRATYDAYRQWVGLRRAHVALRRGGMRWLDTSPESLTFLREHPDQTLLVHVTRDPDAPVRLPLRALGPGPIHLEPLTGTPAEPSPTDPDLVPLPTTPLSAHVWEVSPIAG